MIINLDFFSKWVCALLLIIGAFLSLPNEYYTFLRYVIFIVAMFTAFQFYYNKSTIWTILFGVIAILFNPFYVIFLPKLSWIIIDIISALLFLRSNLSLINAGFAKNNKK